MEWWNWSVLWYNTLLRVLHIWEFYFSILTCSPLQTTEVLWIFTLKTDETLRCRWHEAFNILTGDVDVDGVFLSSSGPEAVSGNTKVTASGSRGLTLFAAHCYLTEISLAFYPKENNYQNSICWDSALSTHFSLCHPALQQCNVML